MMRIISPVDNLAEAGYLLETGVDELCGDYLSTEWTTYSLTTSINRQTFSAAQISSERELAEIIKFVHAQNAPFHEDASAWLQQARQSKESRSQTNRRYGCGSCAIPALIEVSVHALKRVGRGAPAAQKVRNLALTKEFLAHAESSVDLKTYQRTSIAAHKERFGAACRQNVCYHPENFDGGTV